MKKFLLGLLCLCFLQGSLQAAESASKDENSRRMDEVLKQLQGLHDDVTKLSERLKRIEDMIPELKEPEKVNVHLGDSLRLGSHDAKVGIVEFSDYQCPFCRRFHADAFPQLQKTYIDSGKVAMIVKDFPLDFHPAAMKAALAINCAGGQDVKRFWDVQAELFDHQDRLGDDLYKEIVKKYGLDQKNFETCMGDTTLKKKVEDELKYAQSLGVQGTPTFFVGRIEGDQLVDAIPMVGAQPYSAFVQVLESLTKEKGSDKPT